jgi:hypothetical protein
MTSTLLLILFSPLLALAALTSLFKFFVAQCDIKINETWNEVRSKK